MTNPLTDPLSLNSPNLENAVGATNDIINNYSYVTGGPNQSLINSLTEQSKQKAAQYKQNRADASNMYGQLTQTVDSGINVVQQGYDKAVQESSQNALGASSALGNQLQQQVAQRQKMAGELGIGKQVALTPQESDTRINEAMGNIMSSNENWTNLLRAQQQAAKQQGVDTKTALAQSKNQTLMALQQALQQGQGNIANQIAQERGKVGTTQMTPLGNILLGGMSTKIQGLMNENNTRADNLRTGLNAFMTDPMLNASIGGVDLQKWSNPETGEQGPVSWYNYMINQLQQAYSNDKFAAGTPLGPQLQTFAQVFGFPAPYIQNAGGTFQSSGYNYGNTPQSTVQNMQTPGGTF